MKCPRCLVIKRLRCSESCSESSRSHFESEVEMWRAQNRRKTFPKELWAADFAALEVSGTPRGDQESFKEVSKNSKVTIHRACRVIMSSPGATGNIDLASTQLRRGFDPPSPGVIFAVDVVP